MNLAKNTGAEKPPAAKNPNCSPIDPAVPQPLPQIEEEGYVLRNRTVERRAIHAKTKKLNDASQKLKEANNKYSKQIFKGNGSKSA